MTDQTIDWVHGGTELLERTLAGISDEELTAASPLPGWRRGHVLAHLASNADALVNLLTWARTGVPTPMYASPEQRSNDIEAGAARPAAEVRESLLAANARFSSALAAMPQVAWDAPVRTVRGRTISAAEVPWLRVREVWVHAVDLVAGVDFGDFPIPLLVALIEDAVTGFSGRSDLPPVELSATDAGRQWRIGPTDRPPVTVSGELASIAAYLLGRPVPGQLNPGKGVVPTLSGWL